MNIKKIAIAAMMLLATPAAADKIVLHASSWHPEFLGDMNELNPGLGYRWEEYLGVEHLSFEFGGYKNSFGETTWYDAWNYTPWNGFGVFAGVASGYNEAHTFDNGLTIVGGGVYIHDNFTVRTTPAWNRDTGEWGLVFGLSLTTGSF